VSEDKKPAPSVYVVSQDGSVTKVPKTKLFDVVKKEPCLVVNDPSKFKRVMRLNDRTTFEVWG
jgi:hypothetical protein